jgi:hypothetical protein
MGIHRGPNTVKDSLVFGYDTGYGVANNNTATRFYPGEPTVNLLNYDTTMPTWPSSSSNMATLTSKTSARSFTVIGTCNVPGAMTFVYPSITTNTAFHTISATFTNNSTETSNVALYIRGKNNATSTVNQSQTTTMQPGQSIRKTLIGNVLTVNGGYTAAVGVWSHGTSGQVNMNVTDVQFEQTTHATPFVNGTRSSTESLIDLRRTRDIDVSNTSFDSSGQMNFDASDDQIVVDVDSIVRNVDTITIEGIVNASVNAGAPWGILTDHTVAGDKDGFWWHYNIGGYTYFRVEDATAGEQGTTFPGSVPFVSNVNQHVVTVVGLNHVSVYVNGELEQSYTPNFRWNRIDSSKTAYLHIGRTFPNYYLAGEVPVFKMHNRRLTASEIKQSYQSYKKRFNL